MKDVLLFVLLLAAAGCQSDTADTAIIHDVIVSSCVNQQLSKAADTIPRLFTGAVMANGFQVSFYHLYSCGDEYVFHRTTQRDTVCLTIEHTGDVYTNCSCKKLTTLDLPPGDSLISLLSIDKQVYFRTSDTLP